MLDLFGTIVPFRLTVVVCETPPSPSNLMTPTSATGPTGPSATIDPLVSIPNEPRSALTEHESESALADGANNNNTSVSPETMLSCLLLCFIFFTSRFKFEQSETHKSLGF